ncbi:MAG: copper resistance protein CopC, partial [Ilumatobacteraceae bacterium]
MNRTSLPPRAFARALAVFLGVAVVGSFFVARAEAVDNTLLSSTPAADGTVDTSPPSLLLTFASALGATNSVEVVCNGAPIAVGTPAVGVDGVSLSVSVPNPLPKGQCVVSWLVSQPDGGGGGSSTFAFNITNDTVATLAPPVTTPASGSSPTDTGTTTPVVTTSGNGGTATPESGSGGPLGLSRLLISLGVAVLFGSLVLIATAWPEGVEYILTVRFLRSAWLMTLAFTVFNAACVNARISGTGIGSSLSPTSWNSLTDTTPGIAALARVIFVLLTGWVVMRPERVIDPATQLP